MKLKDNVTREQLEKLGFEPILVGNKIIAYEIDECCICVHVNLKTKIIYFYFGECEYDPREAPSVLLKMFKLGYIEESEEQ